MATSTTPSSGPALPHPYEPAPYRVQTRTPETSDTTTLTLVPVDGGMVPSFQPGQFNMVYCFGVGEAAISISGETDRRDRLVHTVRAAGKITNRLLEMRPGSVVGVRGPYGIGWPLKEARGRDVLIVAGGLGLPPLRPLLYEIFSHRQSYGRVEIIYGAKTPKDLVFYDEIQTWRRRTDARIQVTVDVAGREWYGDVGVVTTRIPDLRFDPPHTVAYVCGPEIMMKFTAQGLGARGITPDRIWVSMERNMKCAIGQCGHCQFGPEFICRDGPVFSYEKIGRYLSTREV